MIVLAAPPVAKLSEGARVPPVLRFASPMPQCTRPVTIFATTLCGVAAGLGYRGNLQVVNRSGAAARRSSLELLHLLFCRQRFARDRCRRPFSGCWLDHGEPGFRRYHQRVCRGGARLWRQIHARLEISDPHRSRCAQRENIPRGQSRRSRSVANEQRGLVCDHNEIKLLRPRPNQRRETDRSARRWKACWNPSG